MQSFLIHTCILIPIGYAFQELTQNLQFNKIVNNIININKLEKNEKEFVFFIMLLIISILSYLLTIYIIPVMKTFSIKANLFGYDINKKGSKEGEIKIPESLGVASATIFLAVLTIGVLYQNKYQPDYVLPHVSAILTITYAVYLGFCDDVFDLKWRHKLWIPAVSVLPLLVAYSGVTHIVIPLPLRPYIGYTLELGIFYYLYMILLTIFCTNSINIYAGINGLESGQSLIIACSIMLHNIIEIFQSQEIQMVPLSVDVVRQQHIFSLIFIIPYIAVTLALYKYNQYPSQVFVGDTFCYFSGMVFAVLGILGHFQKTLLLFFIPQIINFVYSLPQILHFIPCPRHRLPTYNTETKKLVSIKTNLNLINFFLLIFGPMSEKALCLLCIIFQILCCAFGFLIRYQGRWLLY